MKKGEHNYFEKGGNVFPIIIEGEISGGGGMSPISHPFLFQTPPHTHTHTHTHFHL